MTYNKKMSKLPYVSLFQILLAMFLPMYQILFELVGKVIAKIKRVNFLLRHSVVK